MRPMFAFGLAGWALALAMFAPAPAVAQMRLPPGTYQYTCKSCGFDGRYLSCACRTSGGQYYRSRMDWGGGCSNQNVANHEGVLVCAEQ